MHNWIGAMTAVLGAWLIYSGLAHRRRVLAARRPAAIFGEPDAAPPHDRSLAIFGDIMRPMIICALGYFALKASLAYVLLGGSRFSRRLTWLGCCFWWPPTRLG